jgi:hypothetical protein
MQDDQEQRIRERAFQIWIEEGQPLGRDKEHWAQARRDLGLGDDLDAPPLQPSSEKAPQENM